MKLIDWWGLRIRLHNYAVENRKLKKRLRQAQQRLAQQGGR